MKTRTLFAAGLALALGFAGPAAAQNLDTDRSKTVTDNGDGTYTIDRTFDREHLPSGRTASGESATVVTPTEDGRSWETTGERDTLRGRSVDYEASGSRTRDGEGGVSSDGTRQWSTTGGDGETKTRTLDYERDKAVTKNDDGSVTVDHSWEKTHQESGKSASGSSSKTYTKTDDGVSWDREGERTTFGGKSFESDGSGSRTRGEDGSRTVQRENTVTNTETGNSRTREAGRSVNPNGDGTGSFSRYGTTTRQDVDGNVTGRRNSSGAGDWQRNGQGGRNFRYDGSTTNSRGRSSDVTGQGRTYREDGERGRQVRSERTFDDGRTVRRAHETKVSRDGNRVQRQDRNRTRRTPPNRRR